MLGDLEKLWSKIKDAPQRREVRPFLKVCADQQTILTLKQDEFGIKMEILKTFNTYLKKKKKKRPSGASDTKK